MNVFVALYVMRWMYLDLGRGEDVHKALSVLLRWMYLDLGRGEDVHKALSVLLRWMYSDLGRSEDTVMAPPTRQWTGTVWPGLV